MTIQEAVQRVKNALKINEYGQAEKLLIKINQKSPDSLFGLLTLGHVYEDTGRPREAFLKYRRAIALYPDQPDGYKRLGLTYAREGNFTLALDILTKALQRGDQGIYFHLGNVYREMESYELAVKEYENALEVDPGNMEVYTSLGDVYEAQGWHKEAEEVYTLGLEHDPNNPGLHYRLGLLFKNNKQFEAARRSLEQAIRMKPGWVDAVNSYGVVLGQLGESEAAIRMFKEVLKIEPGNLHAINNVAIEYARSGREEEAIDCYKQTLEIDHGYYNGIVNLGNLYVKKGYYIEALEEFRKITVINPHNLSARLNYATILMLLELYHEAEDQLHFILKQNPGSVKALRALAMLYIRQGEYSQADEKLEDLRRLDPEFGDFYYDLALSYKDKELFGRSEDNIKKYLEKNPGDINGSLLLGELYMKQENYDQAEMIFKTLITQNPEVVKPYYYLGLIYKNKKQWDEALRIFNRLITIQSSRTSFDDLNNLARSLEMYEEIIKLYEGYRPVEPEEEEDRSLQFNAYDSMAEVREMLTADEEGIIDKGLMEPLIEVREEEEVIDLEKEEQAEIIKEKEIVEIKEEAHTPLMNLLENQDLYDENSLLRTLKAQQNLLDSQQRMLSSRVPGEEESRGTGREYAADPNGGELESSGSSGSHGPGNADGSGNSSFGGSGSRGPGNVEGSGNNGSGGNSGRGQGNADGSGNNGSGGSGGRGQENADGSGNNDSGGNSGREGEGGPYPPDYSRLQQEMTEILGRSMKLMAEGLKNLQPQVMPMPIYMQPQTLEPGESIKFVKESSPPVKRTRKSKTKSPIPPVPEKMESPGLTEDREILEEKESEGKKLKSEIKDFLNRVRKKLDENQEVKVDQKKEQVIGLLDHLLKLQNSIPRDAVKGVNNEELKLKIEYLREKLSGRSGLMKRGLMKRMAESYSPSRKDKRNEEESPLEQVAGTLKFVRGMTAYLPDEDIKKTLEKKLDRVIREI